MFSQTHLQDNNVNICDDFGTLAGKTSGFPLNVLYSTGSLYIYTMSGNNYIHRFSMALPGSTVKNTQCVNESQIIVEESYKMEQTYNLFQNLSIPQRLKEKQTTFSSAFSEMRGLVF